jgi:hypothetical protein
MLLPFHVWSTLVTSKGLCLEHGLTSYLGCQGGDPLVGLTPDILDLSLQLGAIVFQFAVLSRLV